MSDQAKTRAVLFDVDGTLVDSNYLHIDAWHRALGEVGHPVDAWRVHRGIGMDSSRLLEELLPDHDDGLRERATQLHGELYRAMAPRLRAFDGAATLVGSLLDRRVTVVLATSAPEAELDILLDVLGVDPSRLLTTNADDVDVAKPDPGIVEVALRLAGVAASEAVFVGDTVWDMRAATTAGVSAVGVQSGGVGPDELREAGGVHVVRDVAELLTRGDAWPGGEHRK